jgi:hypothetical protein
MVIFFLVTRKKGIKQRLEDEKMEKEKNIKDKIKKNKIFVVV